MSDFDHLKELISAEIVSGEILEKFVTLSCACAEIEMARKFKWS